MVTDHPTLCRPDALRRACRIDVGPGQTPADVADALARAGEEGMDEAMFDLRLAQLDDGRAVDLAAEVLARRG